MTQVARWDVIHAGHWDVCISFDGKLPIFRLAAIGHHHQLYVVQFRWVSCCHAKDARITVHHKVRYADCGRKVCFSVSARFRCDRALNARQP